MSQRLRKQHLLFRGGILCPHGAWIMQCTIMHNCARLRRIMHNAFGRTHKGIANKRDPGTANLLSFGSTTFFLIFRRWKNSIVLQSIFSSGNMCRCILVDKIVHNKHNDELHWTRVKQNIMHDYAQLCTIMQISQMVHCAQLCTIMHVHNFPSPVVLLRQGRCCRKRGRGKLAIACRILDLHNKCLCLL